MVRALDIYLCIKDGKVVDAVLISDKDGAKGEFDHIIQWDGDDRHWLGAPYPFQTETK